MLSPQVWKLIPGLETDPLKANKNKVTKKGYLFLKKALFGLISEPAGPKLEPFIGRFEAIK